MVRRRTKILLVLALGVVPALLLVRSHWASPQDVGVPAAADSVVSAGIAKSDVRIDWPVPDAYPSDLHDLMAFDLEPLDEAEVRADESKPVLADTVDSGAPQHAAVATLTAGEGDKVSDATALGTNPDSVVSEMSSGQETQRVQDKPGASVVEEVTAMETEVLKEQIPPHTEEEVAKEDVAAQVVAVPEEILAKEVEVQKTTSDANGTVDQRDTKVEKTPEAVAVVDARHCVKLGHNELMRGRVSFRKIWNGYDFVTQKVCLVEEGDGISSVWSFVQGAAVVTEVRADSGALKDAIADASERKR
ncbi:MAG: hypothetical protein JSU70_02850 [Phycisphaerales bacterium]|nr:MAG: hypothetical protein JSU70_02850 [Phycisphaerales bacterium]